MFKAWNNDTMECIREGMMDGVGKARNAAKHMRFRSPVVYERTSPAMVAGWIVLILASAGALALVAWLWMRKGAPGVEGYSGSEGHGAPWEADQVSMTGKSEGSQGA